jgi:hypothetical protein
VSRADAKEATSKQVVESRFIELFKKKFHPIETSLILGFHGCVCQRESASVTELTSIPLHELRIFDVDDVAFFFRQEALFQSFSTNCGKLLELKRSIAFLLSFGGPPNTRS